MASLVALNGSSISTDEQWTAIIRQVEADVSISQQASPAADTGSPAFAKTIDHTLLKLDAQSAQIDALCVEARREGFAVSCSRTILLSSDGADQEDKTVCVRPNFVQRSVTNLHGSDVGVASVIGFHEGAYPISHKLQEIETSLAAGAAELDIVLNRTHLQGGKYTIAMDELATLRRQAAPPITLKLILETSHLTRLEIVAACTMAAAAQFDFVKTSTGFDGHGATEADVRLMVACCEALASSSLGQRKMRVKASGGIRTLSDALVMLQAGASRLGVSSGVAIAQEGRESLAQGKISPARMKVADARQATGSSDEY